MSSTKRQNPIAVAMRKRHGNTNTIMKNKGEGKGGDINEQRQLLEEYESEISDDADVE